jgi:hypothetical protein
MAGAVLPPRLSRHMLVQMKLEPPLGVADNVVAPVSMISVPDPPLRRASSIVLALYVGAFLGQAFCVLHASHVESGMGSSMGGSAAHVSSSVATHASSAAAHASSMATHASSIGALDPAQHDERSGASGPAHTGVCGAASCASALTATIYHDPGPLDPVSYSYLAYLGGKVPPDTETVPPPPRLG